MKYILILALLTNPFLCISQTYEFFKEISCFATDQSDFQIYSGLTDITIDKFDNFYVLDKWSHSIIKLDKNKKFIKKWYSSDYKNNKKVLESNSDMRRITMIAGTRKIRTDHEGNVYLLSYKRIHKFNPDGTYIKSITDLKDYTDIAFDKQGNIYCITKYILEKLNTNGEFIENLIPAGAGKYLSSYRSLAIDSKNNLYVSNNSKWNILKFNQKENKIDTLFKRDKDSIKLHNVEDIFIDKKDNIYIADGSVLCLDKNGVYKHKISQTNEIKMYNPHSLAVDSNGNIYVQSQGNGIVEYTNNGDYLSTWGTDGQKDGCLIEPDDLLISKNGFIYITDERKPIIQKFTLTGEFVEVFLKTRDLNGYPFRIDDMYEDFDNNLVLLTRHQDHPLISVNEEGDYLSAFRHQNKKHFKAAKMNNFFFSNRRSKYIKKVRRDGRLKYQFTSIDTSQAGLSVSDFVIDTSGNVIVGFRGHSIQKFNSGGEFMHYVVNPNTNTDFRRSFRSFDTDNEGYIYSLGNDCEVLIFNPSGDLVEEIQLDGKEIPCLSLSEKIAVTDNGEFIYVTDKHNYRVQILKRTSN